ncbi:MAG: host specificity factor TipJ family phage tail protein [Rubrivivax sp.]
MTPITPLDAATAAASRGVPGMLSAGVIEAVNPLRAPAKREIRVPPGTRVSETKPVTCMPLMLRLNGDWLMRADWEVVLEEGDVVEWHVLPQGQGGASKTILTVILAVVAVVYGYYSGDWAGAFKLFSIGMALINVLVPNKQPNTSGSTPGSVYNVQLAQNQARLNQAIPVIYGRMPTYPDFAAQPYGEYIANDQYYHALLCIGQGEYDFERVNIGNSPLGSFRDVTYNILPPGVLPTIVKANVVTVAEVAGQDIKSGAYVGAFVLCGPGHRCTHAGIDVVFASGLAWSNSSGDLSDMTVHLRFEAQQIDDFGVPVSAWFILGAELITRATLTPQRFSFKYALPGGSMRARVRMVRLDAFVDKMNVQNSPALGGLRGYLDMSAPLCSTATHLEVRIRATDQLSQFGQNRINCIVRRKLKTWAPGSGWSASTTQTRSIAWAVADVWTNAVYGDGLPDSRVDLETLYALDQVWSARQDRFDMIFDSKVPSWDAAKTILQAGRATPFTRFSVLTAVRDQLQTLPATGYGSRSIIGGLDMGYSLPTSLTADGVLVEYFSNRTWAWETITCRAPGVVTPTKAPRWRLMGVTGAKQAEREGLYQAAQNVYRRKFPKWSTELQGQLPTYGSLVLFAPDIPGYDQSGDVVTFDAPTLTATLTEPAAFDPAAPAHYVSLMRPDGSMTDKIAVLPGPTANQVVLATAPGFTLVCDDASRERPKYLFGAASVHRRGVRVLGITRRARGKDGELIIEMEGVNENNAIHAVDNALLPSPSEIQDPVDSDAIPVEDGGSGAGAPLVVPSLQDHAVGDQSYGRDLVVEFGLQYDGRAWASAPSGWMGSPGYYPLEWSGTTVLLAPADGAAFEVRFTYVGGIDPAITPWDGTTAVAPSAGGDALGTWHPLSADRKVRSVMPYPGTPPTVCRVLVEIRDVATHTVQASATVSMVLFYFDPNP